MESTTKFNDKDAETVFKAIEEFIPKDHSVEVSVSMDREYFRMSVDGEQVCWDSANSDAYSIDGAIGWFQSWLIEYGK